LKFQAVAEKTAKDSRGYFILTHPVCLCRESWDFDEFCMPTQILISRIVTWRKVNIFTNAIWRTAAMLKIAVRLYLSITTLTLSETWRRTWRPLTRYALLNIKYAFYCFLLHMPIQVPTITEFYIIYATVKSW